MGGDSLLQDTNVTHEGSNENGQAPSVVPIPAPSVTGPRAVALPDVKVDLPFEGRGELCMF